MRYFLLTCCCLLALAVSAQPGRHYVRESYHRKYQQKMDSSYRQPGKKAVQDVTYENDKRYKDPNNRIQATIVYLDSSFKKDRVRNVTSTSIVFGKTGEAYVVRDELDQKELEKEWLVFNYAEKANYIVMPKQKTAMKMPLINFQKMAEHAAKKAAEDNENGKGYQIEATDEYATIQGYRCRKFIAKNEDGVQMDEWVSKDLRINLSGNYVMGARLDAYKFPEQPQYKEMANGFIVRLVHYDKNGRVKYTRSLQRFEKGKADERYFDLSGYKISDVLAGM